jgi:hypothetical protein
MMMSTLSLDRSLTAAFRCDERREGFEKRKSALLLCPCPPVAVYEGVCRVCDTASLDHKDPATATPSHGFEAWVVQSRRTGHSDDDACWAFWQPQDAKRGLRAPQT